MPARTIKHEPLGTPPSAKRARSRIPASEHRNGDEYHTIASASRNPRAEELRLARSGAPSVEAGPGARVFRQIILDEETASEDPNRGDDDLLFMKVEARRPVAGVHNGRQDTMDRLQQELPPNASFVSRGFEVIGAKIKKLNDTLGDLQAMGIDHVTSLPEVVLVGDQSSGKSSIMSAFSSIYLPRSEGVCTRCPVHIRLSRSETWSCRVSIQQEYKFDTALSRQPTRQRRFGPWVPLAHMSTVIKDFITITDRNNPRAVERAIRWAQLAILNPEDDHALYRPDSGGKWRQVDNEEDPEAALQALENNTMAGFSPNRVGLEISGPHLADLSFYDLPGCFQATHHRDQDYLVDVIDNLVDHYISKERAIVLCAIPMNTDPETSKTLGRIRRANASGRTVGVMTKADKLPPTSYRAWISMLNGERFQEIGYGHFITCRPTVTSEDISDESVQEVRARSRNDRDIPRSQSAIDDLERQGAYEESFFNGTLEAYPRQEPWPTALFEGFHDRCGVTALSVFVSGQLSREFEKDLPNITMKLSDRLEQVEAALVTLPDEPESPELEIRHSLHEFITQAKPILGGPERSEGWRKMIDNFRNEVYGLKPKVKVGIQAVPASNNANPVDLTLDDDASSVRSATVTPQNKRRFIDYSAESTPRGSVQKRLCPGSGVKNEQGNDLAMFALPNHRSIAPLGLPAPPPKSKSLAEVRQIIEAHSRPGMPNLVSPDVYNLLCIEAIKPWSGPLAKLVEQTRTVLNKEIQEILQRSFSTMQQRNVYKASCQHLKRLVEDQVDIFQDTFTRRLQVETRSFHTWDQEGLTRYQNLEAKTLLRHRHFMRWSDHIGKEKASELPRLRDWNVMTEEERGQEESRMAKEASRLGPDPFKRELDVCAYVRGYYLLAATRFIEEICLQLHSGLLPEVVEVIGRMYLEQQLGLVGNSDPTVSHQDHIKSLLGEDEATVNDRRRYKTERERLRNAQEKIRALEESSTDDHVSSPDTMYQGRSPFQHHDNEAGSVIA